jgi:hypothetical protein
MSYYSRLIVDVTKCAPEEAPLVEGFMRVTYSTLDGLDRRTFTRAAIKGLREARLDRALAESLARSYGLLRREGT